MKDRHIFQLIRRWAAGFAVLALVLSTSAPMPAMGLPGGSGTHVHCDMPGMDQDDTAPAGHSTHPCQLCLLHCALGWLTPVSHDELGENFAQVIDVGHSLYISFNFSYFGDFYPAIPRAPPVFG